MGFVERTHSAPAPNSGSLIERSLGALKWSYMGVATRIVLQLGAQIALAHFVGPAGFGVVAAATFVIGVAGIFVELGLGSALVQARTLEPADVRFALTRIMLAAVTASGLIIASAELVAGWFGDPKVAPVLRWMTLFLLFQAFGTVSQALLRRNLDFKSVQIAQICSYFVGFFLVGVTCAWLGAGHWSLVAAWVSQACLASAIQYSKARHEVRPRLRGGPTPLTGFGMRTVCASLANWSLESVDNLMVGHAYGTASLGAYAIAYNLARTPVNHVVVGLQQVIFPFAARAQDQDNDQSMQKAYVALLWMVTLITVPTFVGLGMVAPTAIEALYGGAWHESASVLLPLALAMPFQSVQAVGGPVLWGSGQVVREIHVSVSMLILMVIVLAGTSQVSLVAMAWGVCSVCMLRATWITVKVSETLGLSVFKSLSMLRGGLLVGAITSAVLFTADSVLLNLGVPALQRLVIVVCIGAALLLSLPVLLLPVILPAELGGMLAELAKRLPERLGSLIRRRVTGCQSAENAAEP